MVVSNTGGLPEVVTHGETGIVTYANVASSLAWGILEVLQHPEYAKILVENAYADLPGVLIGQNCDRHGAGLPTCGSRAGRRALGVGQNLSPKRACRRDFDFRPSNDNRVGRGTFANRPFLPGAPGRRSQSVHNQHHYCDSGTH